MKTPKRVLRQNEEEVIVVMPGQFHWIERNGSWKKETIYPIENLKLNWVLIPACLLLQEASSVKSEEMAISSALIKENI